VTLEPVVRSKRRLGLKNFDPCTILLNNDLSAGAPGILEDLHEQYLLPPLHAGWSVRRKSRHFQSYEEVAKRFGKLLGIDPWLINPMFNKCGEIDFAEGLGHGLPDRPTSTRCSPRCARSTRNTASTRSRSSSSRPTTAPTAWAS
jgi:hypothetical protein